VAGSDVLSAQEKNEGNGDHSIPLGCADSVTVFDGPYTAPSTNWRTASRRESSLLLAMAGQTGYGSRWRVTIGSVAMTHVPDSATRAPPGSLPHPVTTQHTRCSTFTLRSCWPTTTIPSTPTWPRTGH